MADIHNIVVQITGQDNLSGVLKRNAHALKQLEAKAQMVDQSITQLSQKGNSGVFQGLNEGIGRSIGQLEKMNVLTEKNVGALKRLGACATDLQVIGNVTGHNINQLQGLGNVTSRTMGLFRGLTAISGGMADLGSSTKHCTFTMHDLGDNVKSNTSFWGRLGDVGSSAMEKIRGTIGGTSGGLDYLGKQMTAFMGAMGVVGAANMAWGAATSRQFDQAYLTMHLGAEKAKEMGKTIRDLVAELPGDDTFMKTLLSAVATRGATKEELKKAGTLGADYSLAAAFTGLSSLEVRQDLTSYLTTGDIKEIERSRLITAGGAKKYLEGKETIGERVDALDKLLDINMWKGLSTMDIVQVRWQEFLGIITNAAGDIGSVFLPYLGEIMRIFSMLHRVTGGWSTNLAFIGFLIGGIVVSLPLLIPVITSIVESFSVVAAVLSGPMILGIMGVIGGILLASYVWTRWSEQVIDFKAKLLSGDWEKVGFYISNSFKYITDAVSPSLKRAGDFFSKFDWQGAIGRGLTRLGSWGSMFAHWLMTGLESLDKWLVAIIDKKVKSPEVLNTSKNSGKKSGEETAKGFMDGFKNWMVDNLPKTGEFIKNIYLQFLPKLFGVFGHMIEVSLWNIIPVAMGVALVIRVFFLTPLKLVASIGKNIVGIFSKLRNILSFGGLGDLWSRLRNKENPSVKPPVGGKVIDVEMGRDGIYQPKQNRIRRTLGRIPGAGKVKWLFGAGIPGQIKGGFSGLGKITSGLGKISSSLKSSLSKIPGSLSKVSSRLGSIGGKISSNLSRVSSNLRSGLSKIPNNLSRISSSLRSGLSRVSIELSRIKSTSGGGLGDLGGRGGKSGKGTGRLGKITSKIPGLGRISGVFGKLGGLGRLGGLAAGAARFAGPIGLALTAATAGYSASTGWNETKGPWQEKAKGAVGGAVEQLSMGLVNKKQVMDGLNWLQAAFKDLPGKIQASLGNLWQTITNPLQRAWDNAKTIVGQGVTIVQNFFKNLVDNGRSILGRLWQIITTPLKRAWDNAKSIVGKGVTIVKGFFTNLIANARSILSGIWNAIVGNFKPALDWLGANIWPKIQPIIDGFNSMKSTVTDSVKGIYDKVMEYLGPVAALLDRVTGVIYGHSPGILPGFRKMGRDIPRNVESILPSVNTFRNSLNASLSTTEALRRGLPDIGLYPTPYTGPNPTSVGSIANSRGDGVNHVDNSTRHYHYGPVTINAKDMSRHELKSLMTEIFEDAR